MFKKRQSALIAFCLISLLVTSCGISYGQISSFKLNKIELAKNPSIGALYELTGTDAEGKTVIAYFVFAG